MLDLVRTSPWWAVLILGCWAGCAPSHRVVHQGNRYFEHCYGGDFDRAIPDAEKEACWSAWLAHYTRHQPAHRIDYAMRRVEALQMGYGQPRELPGLAQPGEKGAPEQQVSIQSHPGSWPPSVDSTEVPEPPSETGEELQDPAPKAEDAPAPHGCQQVCDARFERCITTCPQDRGPCVDGCEQERAICRGGCY